MDNVPEYIGWDLLKNLTRSDKMKDFNDLCKGDHLYSSLMDRHYIVTDRTSLLVSLWDITRGSPLRINVVTYNNCFAS